jgi:hypothetical protein
VPVSASTNVDLPWSMWPAVPTMTCFMAEAGTAGVPGQLDVAFSVY